MRLGIGFAIFACLLGGTALLGRMFRVQLARRALVGRSVLFWKAACLSSSLLVWSAIVGMLALVLITDQVWSWTHDSQGQLLGVAVLLAITATAVWEAGKHAIDAYWKNVDSSLNNAIPYDDERRKQYLSIHSILSPKDPRQDALRLVLRSNTSTEIPPSSKQ